MKSIKTVVVLFFVAVFSTLSVQKANAVDTTGYTYFDRNSGPFSISVGPGSGQYCHLFTVMSDGYLPAGQSIVGYEGTISFDNETTQYPLSDYMDVSIVHENTTNYFLINSVDILHYYYIDHTSTWHFTLFLSGGSEINYSYSQIPFVQ